LALLGPGLFLTFVGLVQGTLILAGDHHRAGLVVAGAVTAATLALDLVMVPIWGIAGAAGAASITSLLTCVTFAWFGQRSEGLRTPLPAPGAVGGALLAGAAAWVLSDRVVIGGLVAVALYLGVTAATGAVRRDDLARVRQVLRRAG
ncbi:MAG: polysaccharide biosynthesis C-terminal domain-containing protein, partial [Acidimicrobiales bacterium]